MEHSKYDFSGWATKSNLKCSDGRVIMPDAFKDNDGGKVPVVWNHRHDSPEMVVGHAYLENRPQGVYAYGYLNDTKLGGVARKLLSHGDVCSLSIYANQLVQNGPNVMHGNIREVSLVLAGANPGAFIDSVIQHGEESDAEAVIYSGEDIDITHSDDYADEEDEILDESNDETTQEADTAIEHADEGDEKVATSEKTVKDVVDSMTEEQKTVLYAMVGEALSNPENFDIDDEDVEDVDDTEREDTNMKHNVFDMDDENQDNVLSHSEMQSIIADAKRYGSMKDAFLQHGIEQVDYLFPEAKTITNQPEFISRDMGWVTDVMNGVHHTPFSRIKSMFADITEDEARARGYIKGKLKKDEVFSLLKRTTTPTTVYKKQKMDRDDIIDITDFDVIAWLKGEMRMMLDEELARAFLFGDGRLSSSDDKINELNIRPVWKDDELYTVRVNFTRSDAADQQTQDDANARAFIRAAIKSRKEYKGSGNPIMFINEDMLTNCLLLEDKMGRVIYDTEDKLRTALRVSKIVPVELMENLTRVDTGKTYKLECLYLNLNDYNVGADKGGAVNMFDDFDIDYNQQKYLIETRCSGALVKPFSAVAVESLPKA